MTSLTETVTSGILNGLNMKVIDASNIVTD